MASNQRIELSSTNIQLVPVRSLTNTRFILVYNLKPIVRLILQPWSNHRFISLPREKLVSVNLCTEENWRLQRIRFHLVQSINCHNSTCVTNLLEIQKIIILGRREKVDFYSAEGNLGLLNPLSFCQINYGFLRVSYLIC